MESKIKKILEKIDALNASLKIEYTKLADKYGFSIKEQGIIFIRKISERNKKLKIPTWKYIIPKDIRHLVSMPFIYMMIIPAVILDIFATVYILVAFPLYKIPKIKRSDYFIYERRFLDYLNILQKINCLYCSYVNGLLSYASEIGARTERYWCPVKATHQPKTYHGWYKDFADYGNPEEWAEKFNEHCDFSDK